MKHFHNYSFVINYKGNFSHIKCPPLKLQDYEYMKCRDQNKPKEEAELKSRYFNRVYSSFKQGRSKSVNPEYSIMAIFDIIEPKKKIETQISYAKTRLTPRHIVKKIETQLQNKENRASLNKLRSISRQSSKTTQRSTILSRETSQNDSSCTINKLNLPVQKIEINHRESQEYQSLRGSASVYNRFRQTKKIR